VEALARDFGSANDFANQYNRFRVQTEGQHSRSELRKGVFATTHWSVVLAAGQRDAPQVADALEQLCRAYWLPLYAYVRRRGYGHDDAQDLTQEFFARLLAKEWLSAVDPHRGRFRTFLLAALNHFLTNEWHRARCQKRGGARETISWDGHSAEDRYRAEPVDDLTPERIFQQRWAEALLERVLNQLREEYAVTGKLDFFEVAKEQLWGAKTGIPQARLAGELGLSEGAMKVAMHRLRRRYRELLHMEIAQTVGSAEEIDAELRELMATLRG
jgi:RNA polymerase sigma-70 factor (ECF subfamily)